MVVADLAMKLCCRGIKRGVSEFFIEAKRSADEVADGDVATLIDKGYEALEKWELDDGQHQLAAQRAGYWGVRFSDEDWCLVKACVGWLKAADPKAVRLVVSEAALRRTPDMNTDLHEWTASLAADDLSPPPSDAAPECLRAWAKRLLLYIMDLCEQSLRNYLGIIIAARPADGVVADVVYWNAQNATLHKLLNDPATACKGTASPAAPDEVTQRLKLLEDQGLRAMRNARAHLADFTIVGGRVRAGEKEWTPEEMRGAFELLVSTLGALSLAVTIGAGRHYKSSGGSGHSEAADACFDLSAVERLLCSWMGWPSADVSLAGTIITAEVRSSDPIRFKTLVHAASHCRLLEGEPADTMICRVTPADAANRAVSIELPISSSAEAQHLRDNPDDEEMMLEWSDRTKIDNCKLMVPTEAGGYGGWPRMQEDYRFWEAGRQSVSASYSGAPGIWRPVGILWPCAYPPVR